MVLKKNLKIINFGIISLQPKVLRYPNNLFIMGDPKKLALSFLISIFTKQTGHQFFFKE